MHVVAKLESIIFATGGPEPLSESQLDALCAAFGQPRSRSEMRDMCDRIEALMNRLRDFLEFASVVLEQIELLASKMQFKAESSSDDPKRKAQALLGHSFAVTDVARVSAKEKPPGALSLLALRAGS